jgi:hypothetical protein
MMYVGRVRHSSIDLPHQILAFRLLIRHPPLSLTYFEPILLLGAATRCGQEADAKSHGQRNKYNALMVVVFVNPMSKVLVYQVV